MIKWLVIAVAAYLIFRLFTNDAKRGAVKEEKVDKKEMERKIAAGEMVKDPSCGAYVSVDDSITVRDGKKLYHFCSYECRDRFLKSIGERAELPGDKED